MFRHFREIQIKDLTQLLHHQYKGSSYWTETSCWRTALRSKESTLLSFSPIWSEHVWQSVWFGCFYPSVWHSAWLRKQGGSFDGGRDTKNRNRRTTHMRANRKVKIKVPLKQYAVLNQQTESRFFFTWSLAQVRSRACGLVWLGLETFYMQAERKTDRNRKINGRITCQTWYGSDVSTKYVRNSISHSDVCHNSTFGQCVDVEDSITKNWSTEFFSCPFVEVNSFFVVCILLTLYEFKLTFSLLLRIQKNNSYNINNLNLHLMTVCCAFCSVHSCSSEDEPFSW